MTAQQTMMNRVGAARAEIASLKVDSKARMDASKAEVEAMILGTQPVE
jgi:hypothetical protein